VVEQPGAAGTHRSWTLKHVSPRTQLESGNPAPGVGAIVGAGVAALVGVGVAVGGTNGVGVGVTTGCGVGVTTRVGVGGAGVGRGVN
jgi:hypothetical protein